MAERKIMRQRICNEGVHSVLFNECLIKDSFDPSRNVLGSEASNLVHDVLKIHQRCIRNLPMFGCGRTLRGSLLILPKCSRHFVEKLERDAYVLTIFTWSFADVLRCVYVFTCFYVLRCSR